MIAIIIIISLFLFSSWCKKGPYPVPVLKIKYTNLSTYSNIKAIRTDRNNLSVILDTISLGELNSSNSFSALIEFGQNSPNYIIFVENTAYIDTISDINFERKGSKEKIENFEYKFNGGLRTEAELIISWKCDALKYPTFILPSLCALRQMSFENLAI